jgi:hypothetical protein
MEVSGHHYAPAALSPEKKPVAIEQEAGLSPRVRLAGVIRDLRNHCTDATPVLFN